MFNWVWQTKLITKINGVYVWTLICKIYSTLIIICKKIKIERLSTYVQSSYGQFLCGT